jgi:O-methyltransferase
MGGSSTTGEALADAIRTSLAGVREVRAARPGSGAEALRAAYLDLLKLCLCDLAGTTTVSVGPTPEGTLVAREMRGDQLRVRAVGLDWPLQGMTMSGLRRLDDLQACVDSVVRDGVEGDFIEAGAWRGGAAMLMRAALDSLGDDRERTVWVADSFQGFPDRGRQDPDSPGVNAQLKAFDFLAVPEQEVRDNFARLGFDRGVRFLAGFFEATLPTLTGRQWAIVRLDGDSYEATRVGLESLYPGLSPGGYLIVDDYGAVEECRRAVDEFRREHDVDEPLDTIDWTCVRWRRRSDKPGEEMPAVQPPPVEEGEPPVAESHPLSVPSVTEVQLAHEVEELRARLRRLEEGLDVRTHTDAAGSGSGSEDEKVQ